MFFFFNDTATTEIYTLSLHDALPILNGPGGPGLHRATWGFQGRTPPPQPLDRKSTRLNSSHSQISYAVFCLKKKKTGQGRLLQTPLASTTPSSRPAGIAPPPPETITC